MKGLGEGPLKGCVYEINGSSYDEANKMAATMTGTHVGDGGPVPPTNKQTKTDLCLGADHEELYPKVDGAVKSCWPMACLYRSLRFGEEYLPVSALLVDKT